MMSMRHTVAAASRARTSLAVVARRGYARQQKPLEMDGEVFKCESRQRFFTLMSLASTIQALFWASASTLALEIRDPSVPVPQASPVAEAGEEKPATAPVEEVATRDSPLASSGTRFLLASLSIGMSVVFMFAGVMIPRRFVRRLDIVDQGRKVFIETYQYPRGTASFEVPIADIQFRGTNPTAAWSGNSTFRVANKKFFYIMDGKEGQLVSPNKYTWLYSKAAPKAL